MVTNNTQGGIDRLALQAVLQQAAATVAAMPASVVAGASGAVSAPPPRTADRPPTSNAPVLPSVSEELAMAAQLAPPVRNEAVTEKATMAESQPPAAIAVAPDNNATANEAKQRQQIPEEPKEASEQPTKRRRGSK